jgi:hypothetical protein
VDLTERDEETHSYKRTIVKAIEPNAYGITVADYFLAQEDDEMEEEEAVSQAEQAVM